MNEFTPEMKREIIEKGRKVWHELYDENTEMNIVGVSQKIDFVFDGCTYELTIDAFWDRSKYFDYTIKGHGIDKTILVAAYI